MKKGDFWLFFFYIHLKHGEVDSNVIEKEKSKGLVQRDIFARQGAQRNRIPTWKPL